MRFNPYSTGFSSFINGYEKRGKDFLEVSILILLDSLLLLSPFALDNNSNTGFQSLFYWILFFYDIPNPISRI